MREMKYIIFFSKEHGESPIVFPTCVNHIDMATAVEWESLGDPVTAGFIKIVGGVLTTYGISDSLNLKSDPQDAVAITALLGGKT